MSPTTDKPSTSPTTDKPTRTPSTSPTTDKPTAMPLAEPFSVLLEGISNYHGNPMEIESEIKTYGADYVEFRKKYHKESRRKLSGLESGSHHSEDKVGRRFTDSSIVWTFASMGSILGCFLIVTSLYGFKDSCLSKNAYTLQHIGDEAA